MTCNDRWSTERLFANPIAPCGLPVRNGPTLPSPSPDSRRLFVPNRRDTRLGQSRQDILGTATPQGRLRSRTSAEPDSVSARESASNILRAQQTGLPGQGRRSQLPLRPGRQDCHLPLEPDLTAGSNLQIGHGPATPGARHRADKPSTRVLRRVGHVRSIGRIGRWPGSTPESSRRQGLRPRGRHHEIYLEDPRRSAPSRGAHDPRQPVED
jgi:hypothetical protein